jgi:hypothetical protein
MTRSSPIPSPGAFVIRGSGGYTIGIAAVPARGKVQDHVLVEVVGDSGAVLYEAAATLEDEKIQADLGSVGAIDVSWQPDGRVGVKAFKCQGYGARVYFAEGFYVGNVRILGEEGFTRASVSRVNGRTGWYRYTNCLSVTREGYPGPGVLLEAFTPEKRQRPNSSRRLSVVQNRPHRQVSYFAHLGERSGRLSILRWAFALGRARTLHFDHRLTTAIIDPPLPFAGTATFERIARRGPGSWLGDLVVDFPGKPGVALAGADFKATFMHGFRESGLSRRRASLGG